MGKKILTWTCVLLGLAGLGLGALAYWFIALYPANDIGPEAIKKLLAVESPVFYQDGVHKVGVIFEDSHRQYLPYAKIPPLFVKAIVAAEDHNFFTHHGVDLLGILRAMIADLKAGHIVQGGSTLTQQAAKNLFKREGRTFKDKFKELLYAWRLESHYSKQDILEFYANQFYVSGNGLGLGVAAKYYFDQEPQNLSLVENAFIAGSVKRPNYYNPFIKHDATSAQMARRRAKERTAYVLGQMRELGMISEAEYKEAIAQDIPFKQGQTSFAADTLMDVVREALAEPEVEEALAAHGIDKVAGSGIRIVTTVDRDLQVKGLAELRDELSRLSVQLQGYDQQGLQEQYRKLAASQEKTTVEKGAYLFGRVLKVDGAAQEIEVSLADSAPGGGPPGLGVIDRAGMNALLEAQARYLGQGFRPADRQPAARFLDSVHPDDLVYVAVRDQQPAATGPYRLDLRKYPDLQGAVIGVREGRIITMLGGSDNRFFNRALDAKRIMGSAVKPMVYSAALQLGWNPADLLYNQREAFVYQNQEYFPRPDHQSPYAWVSMSWAGTKSENLASVWLLYHLCDRLNPDQFKELVNKLGLGRGPDESYPQYSSRIRDQFGILINDQALRRLAFDRAVESIGPDLLFDGKGTENELLRHFNYQLAGKVEASEKATEKLVRQEAVRRTFVEQQRYYRQLQAYRARIEAGVTPGSPDDQPQDENDNPTVPAQLFAGPNGAYLFAANPPGPDWRLLGPEEAAAEASKEGGGNQFWDAISLDGLLTAGTFRQLTELVGQEFQKLSPLPPYDPAVLYQTRDFRVLVGLRYLIALARELGVTSPLEPVLSFPLGSNVISPLEVARAYETMVTGMSYHAGRPGADVSLMAIDRIEDSDGQVIYQPQRPAKRVLDEKSALAIDNILKNVVKYGTGHYARTRIRLRSQDAKRQAAINRMRLEVPVVGKTGTANDFRNSAFAGYVPEARKDGDGLELAHGCALAAYVGYDDNRPMTHNSLHITGAAGALELWSDLADEILNVQEKAADRLQLDKLTFSADIELPLLYPDLGQVDLDQAQVTGIASQVGDPAVLIPEGGQIQIGPGVVTFGTLGKGGELTPARQFKPFWGEQ